MKCIKLLPLAAMAIFLFHMLLGCSERKHVSPADPEHIQQLISTLPPDSQMRTYLVRGDRGDGEYYPWMNLMKNLGVRRVKVILAFDWVGKPEAIHAKRTIFFDSYDSNCAQITDAQQLQRIENAGLGKSVREFAVAKTAKSDWTYFEHRPQASHGIALVEVADDPWLPVSSPVLVPDDDSRLVADGDVIHLQNSLASKTFPQGELDWALLNVASHLDDECSVKPLIKAGANPNARDREGWTPLMLAAYAGLGHNVNALLTMGADAKTKNVSGQTASIIAQERGHPAIASVIKQKADAPQ